VLYYPTAAFRGHYENRALFIAHVKKEGKILLDRRGFLREVLAKPFTPVVNIEEGITGHLIRLRPYVDPTRFDNNFLFCLAHLYSIGKGVVMLALADAGALEFDRKRAFKRFTRLHPSLRSQIAAITVLRPFYNLVTGRRPEPLPFSYHRAKRPMRMAVAAIRALAKHTTGR